jgi:ubiquitin thioesterase OTU1
MRIKGPAGTAALTLADDATVGDLISQIAEKTSISSFEVKYGFPPKPLLLDERSKPLKDLGVKLDGESLTISPKDDPAASRDAASDKQSPQNKSPSKAAQKGTKETAFAPSVSFAGMNSSEPKKKSTKPVSLQKKAMEGEVPEVPLPERGATLGMAIVILVVETC